MRTFDEVFGGERVLAILRGLDVAATVEACESLWSAGVRCIEVTIQTPAAVPSLVAACAAARERGYEIGAGTVTDVGQVREVERAGAAYTVAPGLDEAVVRACRDADLPHLAGVATSSEIQRARALGLTWLKAFPASTLQPQWISAQRAPFPWVRFVATGGVDATNAVEFLDAGADVVGLGSSVLRAGALERVMSAVGTNLGPAAT